MKILRKLLVLLFVILTLCSACLPAYAATADCPPEIAAEGEGEGIEPRADVIVIKYRVKNGVYQFRRWNETQGYWVDPEWMDM